ncbi:MAG: acyltransferase [Verrucomicrobia bacterium]|nr:MAG: acyltransferase [Verrucomicrobiota bacterium]
MPNPAKTKVALVQMRCGPKPAANLAHALELIGDAAKNGAQIVCLPELFRSQYFCQSENHDNFSLAETIPGPSTEALTKLAREKSVIIVASLFEKRAAGVFHNTAVMIDADGNILGKYRKMHIPDDPSYYEKFYFTPGDLGFQSWKTTAGNLGVCICWDQWYPEAARLTALRGAEIIFYPTAIGWHPSEKEKYGDAQFSAWQTMQRSHAIANGCFVAAANRVGHEAPAGGDGIEFWGQSFICAPSGEILAQGSVDREEIVTAEIDWSRVNEHRTHWPFLRDRRVDAYAGLERRMLD